MGHKDRKCCECKAEVVNALGAEIARDTSPFLVHVTCMTHLIVHLSSKYTSIYTYSLQCTCCSLSTEEAAAAGTESAEQHHLWRKLGLV